MKFLNENRLKKLLLGVCLGIISISLLNAQNSNPYSPKLHCISIDDDGGIRLTWGFSEHRENFYQYEYWCSTNGAPYSVVSFATNPNESLFVNGTANGMTDYYCYFVRQVNFDGTFYDSDTLCNRFNLSAVYYADGTVLLSWTSARYTALLPGDAAQYMIYKKNPGVPPTANWDNLVASVPTTTFSYRDTAMICDDTVRYKVQLAYTWQGGYCNNGSKIAKVRVKDMIAPKVPVLDSVSVVNGQIALGWEPSKSTDVGSYIIYTKNGSGIWVAVDTVYGRNNTYWTDPVNSPANGVYQYRIAAMDTCIHSSPMIELEQNNMLLNASIVDVCSGIVNLSWNPYSNMTNGLNHYQIWMARNGGAYSLVGQSSSNTYQCGGIQNQNHYDFKVKAVNSNGAIKASSNVFSLDINFDEKKDLCYITSVSVTNNTHIDIEIFTSGDTLPFNNMELYKSENDGVSFDLLTTLPYLSGQTLYHYTDAAVAPNERSYYYKAIIHGACSPNPTTSNIAHTILLRGETNDSYTNTLRWNNYEKWDGLIDRFTVLRKMEIDGMLIPVNDVMPNNIANIYSDDVSEMFNTGSLFQYQVTAYERSNRYGIAASSSSNIIVLQQTPATYMPNAFTPNSSRNNIFQPKNSFVPLSDYHFYIYDRYGSLVFFTNNPYEGWDGYAKNGKMVMPGVYVWRLKYSYDRDKFYDNAGTVVVFH